MSPRHFFAKFVNGYRTNCCTCNDFCIRYFCMEMRKYTPVRAEMNLAVMDAVELGLFTKWSSEGLPIEAFLDYDSLQAYDEKKPMRLQQILLPLFFCATGLLVATLTLGWETRACLFKRHSSVGIQMDINLFLGAENIF